MLRFDRKQQNSVKQLSFNKKINYLKKKKLAQGHTIEPRYLNSRVHMLKHDAKLPSNIVLQGARNSKEDTDK